MRLKSYYTAKEVTNNLYTYGNEWQLIDNTEYIGLYHRYATGEVYTQPEWNSKTSAQLFAIDTSPDVIKKYNNALSVKIKTKYPNTPMYIIPSISLNDINNGYITRYFLKKNNEYAIIEIDETQFINRLKLFDPKLYITVSIQWYITGNLSDIKQGNSIKFGVTSKNLKEIQNADDIMTGIIDKLTNLQEFYINDNIKTPPDINSK